MKRALVAVAVAAAIAWANVTCPIDGSSMIWTGQTQFEWGKMLKQYRCLMGHVSWIVQ